MTTIFKWSSQLVNRLTDAFDITDGHDHDGVNSKAVTVGTVADDAITTVKILNGALSADATGRAKMADNFITANKILADAVTTVKILDANVTLAKLATTAKTRVFNYQVEDLAANADITTRAVFECPTGLAYTITAAKIISQGTPAGIDDSNTCVVQILNGASSIASVTYNTSVPFPAVNVAGSLGSLSASKAIAAGDKVHLVVTNGTTANPPAFMLQVEYTVADA